MLSGLALTLAACTSSAGGSSPGASTPAPSSSAPPASSAVSTAASSGASGAPSAPGPDVTAAVTKAYNAFFSPKTDLAGSEAALQHGMQFKATLEAEASSQYANQATIAITSVTPASADVADVKFTLKTSGLSLPVDGKAVREDGTWKVAAVTFCGLLQAEGHAPKLCSDPAVVGLPG
ncbi:MAG: hypothetical protein ACTHMS_18340 [Jatrophihabitans sp.]|uniref:hypothetical protein n=1 Tax=Jatrophihabitans sp. TaxID=1932789 RepID=UPI003F805EAB